MVVVARQAHQQVIKALRPYLGAAVRARALVILAYAKLRHGVNGLARGGRCWLRGGDRKTQVIVHAQPVERHLERFFIAGAEAHRFVRNPAGEGFGVVAMARGVQEENVVQGVKALGRLTIGFAVGKRIGRLNLGGATDGCPG